MLLSFSDLCVAVFEFHLLSSLFCRHFAVEPGFGGSALVIIVCSGTSGLFDAPPVAQPAVPTALKGT